MLAMALRTWDCCLAHWDTIWGLSGVKYRDAQGVRAQDVSRLLASPVDGARTLALETQYGQQCV